MSRWCGRWAAACGAAALAACGGGGGVDADTPAAATAPTVHALNAVLRDDAAPVPIGATALFRWAEAQYPALFPGGATDETAIFDGRSFVFRRYPASGNYLGVADGHVYLLGPASHNGLTDLGWLSDYTCRVAAGTCQPPTGVPLLWEAASARWDGVDWQ